MCAISRERQIEIVAFRLWLERGCPNGTSHVYWQEAERLLGSVATPAELGRSNRVTSLIPQEA
jgi:hypothetical protein